MAVVPVLRRINARMRERLPDLHLEIGNAALSKPGNQRLIWEFTRGDIEGGFPTDSTAKVIAIRQVGLVAEIRVKLAKVGLTADDYERAEEVVRNLFVVLDELCSGDWLVTSEDWTQTVREPNGDGVIVRLAVQLAVKVLDDPWTLTDIDTVAADPSMGALDKAAAIS